MLKGMNPLVSPELLCTLAGMGHGDVIAVVDRNFPASALGRRVHRLPGTTAPEVVQAVLSLMPLDAFVDSPVERMEIDGAPSEMGEVHLEVERTVAEVESAVQLGSVGRSDFYDRARVAFAIVQTGEDRPYGCFLLHKGVL